MYSGTTLRLDSGRIIGVHQKIDRIARRHLDKFIKNHSDFPGIQDILHFEGKNGPDGIKLKSPSQDEPGHFINPNDLNSSDLLVLINNHIINLSEALRTDNYIRASFEAAWLAHSVVDGLTPAHHYPLDEKTKAMWNSTHLERLELNDITDIFYLSRRKAMIQKLQNWGMGGISTHILFEAGVASAIVINKYKDSSPSQVEINRLVTEGFRATFLRSLNKIYDMHMYDEFGRKGWTRSLAATTRKTLIPEIIRTVTLAWYQAAILSQEKLL